MSTPRPTHLTVAGGRPVHRVLILGGGFGGLHTAMHLERLLRGRQGVEITLVAKENFFLFTPMLHEVAASDLKIRLEEVRFLEMLAGRLNLEKLTCAALERAARARHQQVP